MHRSRPLAILVLVLLLAACSNSAASSAPAAGGGAASDDGSGGGGETVSLAGFAFSPSELTIPAGTTVTFTDTANHTVTEGTDGEAVDDPIVDEDGGSDIEVTFDEPGTYNITCKIHPDMNMTITVEG
ncbi:MAG TPA: cupredoxin domain-containing protein [Candidatus Limnocylindria bacterium]